MRRLFIPLVSMAVVVLSSPVLANDDWTGPDKTKHFIVSAALGTVSGVYVENKWKAFGLAMVPGLIKEIMDANDPNNHFSSRDLVADALGAAVGVHVGHWIISRRGVGYQTAF